MRLRLLVPRAGRGRGLRGLRLPRRRAIALGVLLALLAGAGVLAVVSGGDDSPDRRAEPAVPQPEPPPRQQPERADAPEDRAPAGSLATGLTERNASLLFAPSARTSAPEMAPWQARAAALRPAYYRLSVDWSQLQPSPGTPAVLDKPDDGCMRGQAPCGLFAGIRDQLRAAKSQQEAEGGWQVVVVLYGVPDWAARPAGGCERPDIGPRSRPINARGLDGYRRLIRDLLSVARQEGVELRWWSPWNEPNQEFFISPQRPRCDGRAAALAPDVYAQLVRAASAELKADGAPHDLVLGDLAGVDGPGPRVTGIAEFVRELPDDVACAGTVWAQHAYVEPSANGPVGQLRRALDRRPCTRGKHLWITETGVGGAHAGERRDVSRSELRTGCLALNRQLRRWYTEADVDAAFQYTFREDPSFSVGLADPALTRTYPAYAVWRAWGARRNARAAAPKTRAVCR